MTIDVNFYTGFPKWVENKSRELVQTKPEQVPQFAAEAAAITGGLLNLIKDLGACFRGGFLGIAVNVGRWIAANPDPLKPTRDAIRAMFTKWGNP